jgi:ppGpp synthetase/RelA/SpoT-type nucleotidyltranferase
MTNIMLVENKKMDFIDDFLAHYQREYDFYLAVARLCQQQCETMLAQKGIRAIVTSRAKKYERLEQKVRQRAFKKKDDNKDRYACITDIYDDIVDLAGVRIALYFPGNVTEVDELIKSEFTLKEEPITYPKDDPENLMMKNQLPYDKRFTGYGATHYRVFLKKENIVDQRYSKSCIEIQVASVLMHAWAEVEHDLLYKPLSGELSIGEHAILDEINGLVLTGEIALERLQNAQEVRLGKDGTQFIDQYELAIFLHNHFRTRVQNPNMIIGRADVLFLFLQSKGLNYPEKLREYTEKLNITDENQTILISDQLLDIILGTDEDLYKMYEKALFEVNARSANSSAEAALGYFLTRWIDLERALRTFMDKQGIKSYPPGLSNQAIQKALSPFPNNYEIFEEFARLRRLRNEVVHGAEIPDIETLNKAAQSLTDLQNKLPRSNAEDEQDSDQSV